MKGSIRNVLVGLLFAGGCASSQSLVAESDAHLREAQAAQCAGNMALAHSEQRHARYLYERAAARAYEEGKPPPPAPPTLPPFPVRSVF
jgi:hypothetical protein